MTTTAELLKIMACPVCQGSLASEKTHLRCTSCKRQYQVRNQVPIVIATDTEWGREADADRLTYNEFYTKRIEQQDGWWVPKSDPYIHIRDNHNLDTSRWFVTDLIKQRGIPNEVVLDAGGGEGYVTAHLLELYKESEEKPTIICYDLSDDLLADGMRRYPGETFFFIAGDGMHMALKGASVDTVICIEAVEHIRDLDNFAREMFRVVKPGGRVYITTPNKHSLNLRFNDRGLYHIYNVGVWASNLFRAEKKPYFKRAERYGFQDNDEYGYECYQSAKTLTGFFERAGFDHEGHYFTEWAGEAFYTISQRLHLPLAFVTFMTKCAEFFERPLRQSDIAELIGFTQIAVFERPLEPSETVATDQKAARPKKPRR